MATLTQAEIIALKGILDANKVRKARPALPRGIPKLLVGPHGRVVGRVLVTGRTKPPSGHTFAKDNPNAKIGQRVVRGKANTKSGRKYSADVLDADGEIINRIVIEEGNEPDLDAGHTMQEQVNA